MWSSIVERAGRALVRRLVPLLPEPRVIYDRDGKRPYLSRYYMLFRDRSDTGDRFPLNVFLHHFHRGDDDQALHNHPWHWSAAIILAGGYTEERRTRTWADGLSPSMAAALSLMIFATVPGPDIVVRRVLRPGSINVIRANDYHRVDLLDEDRGAWSIFIAGPRTGKSWGFWDRVTGITVPWKTFVEKKRGLRLGDEPDSLREHVDKLDAEQRRFFAETNLATLGRMLEERLGAGAGPDELDPINGEIERLRRELAR